MFRHWAIPGKTQTRGLRIHFSEPPLPPSPLEFLIFLLYHSKFQTKQGSNPGYFTKLCYYFFLVTLGNSTSFLINSWKFYILNLNIYTINDRVKCLTCLFNFGQIHLICIASFIFNWYSVVAQSITEKQSLLQPSKLTLAVGNCRGFLLRETVFL